MLIGVGIRWFSWLSQAQDWFLGSAYFFIFYLQAGSQFICLASHCCVRSSLFLLSALLFDGSVVGFLTRVKLGIEFSMFQGGG